MLGEQLVHASTLQSPSPSRRPAADNPDCRHVKSFKATSQDLCGTCLIRPTRMRVGLMRESPNDNLHYKMRSCATRPTSFVRLWYSSEFASNIPRSTPRGPVRCFLYVSISMCMHIYLYAFVCVWMRVCKCQSYICTLTVYMACLVS
jgi:hypothetical protein